jgi:putative phage-type endonuclease
MGADRAEWLAERRKGLGGSDMAAILGLSPWRTAVDVWMDKTGKGEDQPETPAMRWGTLLEDLVAKEYAEKMNVSVTRVNQMLKNPSMPFLIGNIDRAVSEIGKRPVVNGEFRTERILECKTSRTFSNSDWGPEMTDEIPVYYMTQVLHYLGLTGTEICDVACLFDGRDFKVYRVRKDMELINRMWEKAARFWEDHVLKDTPPDPVSASDVSTLFPRSSAKAIEASGEVAEAARKAEAIKNHIKDLEAQLEAEESKVKLFMLDNDALTIEGKTVLTWKCNRDSTHVKWEALATEALECLGIEEREKMKDRYTARKPGARVFRFKTSKKEEGA